MQIEPTDDMPGIDELDRSGDVLEALAAAVEENRANPSAELERLLVELRHRAARAYQSSPRSPWPMEFEDPFPDVGKDQVPEIAASELTAELLGAAVAHHGSLIVRSLFDPEQVARTRRTIDDVVHAATGDDDAAEPGLYEPTVGMRGKAAVLRSWVIGRGGVWLGDSPHALAQVLDDLEDAGVTAVVADHFGERPVISLEKSTLRKVQPEYQFTAWHQDGSFLGEGARAMNVWIALTECGGDRPAPGLEIVTGRVPMLFPLDGESGNASIDGMEVHLFAKYNDLAVTQPEFDPGDALLFDELMAHRTYYSEGMTEARSALECWFFAPSNPAETYDFLLV